MIWQKYYDGGLVVLFLENKWIGQPFNSLEFIQESQRRWYSIHSNRITLCTVVSSLHATHTPDTG